MVTDVRFSTGIPQLDKMLDGKGYYQGSSIYLTGTSGMGKSCFAATFVDRICSSGKDCLYFCFEESKSQVMRNMRSIGIHLERWEKNGRLHFFSIRPSQFGIEEHLITMIEVIAKYKPQTIVLDPISNFKLIGTPKDIKLMLLRFIYFAKSMQITTFFTGLIESNVNVNTQEEVSSLMDTWILLELIQNNGKSNRVISIIKSRGMCHSNKTHNVEITNKGIVISDPYTPNAAQSNGTNMQQENDAEISKKHKLLELEVNNLKLEMQKLSASNKKKSASKASRGKY